MNYMRDNIAAAAERSFRRYCSAELSDTALKIIASSCAGNYARTLWGWKCMCIHTIVIIFHTLL